MRLNLGCGWKKLNGYVNVDVCDDPDLTVDLNKFPWPWEDNSVNEVYSSNWLEHVENIFLTLLEIHRVLKPGGLHSFIVPHRNAPLAPTPFHNYYFSYSSVCHLFDGNGQYKFGGKKLFKTECCKYLLTPKTRFMEFIPNIYPKLWDYLNLPGYELFWKGFKVNE